MPKIFPNHIGAARAAILPLTFEKAESIADAIFKTQPNLLASVIVLTKFGVSNEQLDVLFKLLFIIYKSVDNSGATLPLITEDIQEKCLARMRGRISFTEDLDESLLGQAISQQLSNHGEPFLLALCLEMLQASDLAQAARGLSRNG